MQRGATISATPRFFALLHKSIQWDFLWIDSHTDAHSSIVEGSFLLSAASILAQPTLLCEPFYPV